MPEALPAAENSLRPRSRSRRLLVVCREFLKRLRRSVGFSEIRGSSRPFLDEPPPLDYFVCMPAQEKCSSLGVSRSKDERRRKRRASHPREPVAGRGNLGWPGKRGNADPMVESGAGFGRGACPLAGLGVTRVHRDPGRRETPGGNLAGGFRRACRRTDPGRLAIRSARRQPIVVLRRPGSRPGQGLDFGGLGGLLPGHGDRRVLGWWFDPKTEGAGAASLARLVVLGSSPGRPSCRLAGRPAISWLVDHRDVRSPCRFELFGGGRSWLGPSWSVLGGGRADVATQASDLDHRIRGRPGRMVLSRRADSDRLDPRCSCAAGAWPCCRSSSRVESPLRTWVGRCACRSRRPSRPRRWRVAAPWCSRTRSVAAPRRCCRSACLACLTRPIADGSRSRARSWH